MGFQIAKSMNRTVSLGLGELSQKTPPCAVFLLWFAMGLLVSAPGLSTRTPYYDEIFETRIAVPPISKQILERLNPASPPLYHILLHPLLMIFGPTFLTMRSISWLTGATSVALMFTLLKDLFARPWPTLGTLGFMLSSWHIVLSQTARQHSLFLMFTLLSLVLFIRANKRGNHFVLYCLALVAASHSSYWGPLVVLPAHFFATYLMEKRLRFWNRAAVAQIIAGSTALVYIFPIIRGYNFISEGTRVVVDPLTVAYFGSIIVQFAGGHPGQLELADLSWLLVTTFAVLVAIPLGIRRWACEPGVFPRWLGLCCALFVVLLFTAYIAGSSHMVWAPMLRKFAILHIPLLTCFLYGVSGITWHAVRYSLFAAWAIPTALFGFRFLSSDLYKGAQLVAEHLARLRPPMTIFLNFDTLLPPEQGSLAFLLEKMNAAKEREFRYFDFRSIPSFNVAEDHIVCFSYMREGNFFWSELNRVIGANRGPHDPDAKFNDVMRQVASGFRSRGWTTAVSQYYPGRISFKVDCLQKAIPSSPTALKQKQDL